MRHRGWKQVQWGRVARWPGAILEIGQPSTQWWPQRGAAPGQSRCFPPRMRLRPCPLGSLSPGGLGATAHLRVGLSGADPGTWMFLKLKRDPTGRSS